MSSGVSGREATGWGPVRGEGCGMQTGLENITQGQVRGQKRVPGSRVPGDED